jgi:hypothetical protein
MKRITLSETDHMSLKKSFQGVVTSERHRKWLHNESRRE